MRRMMSFAVKAIISVLLLYIALRGVDLGSIKERLGSIDFRWMTLSLFVLCAQMALVALRWRQIVVMYGARLPRAAALNYTFSGQFFNQVLPSTVGGDAVRAWLLTRRGVEWPTAIYSVFTDRLVGVSVLAALVVACLPWSVTMIHDPIARAALAVIGFGALAGVMGFLMLGAMPLRMMERWWFTRHLAVVSRLAWRSGPDGAALSVRFAACGQSGGGPGARTGHGAAHGLDPDADQGRVRRAGRAVRAGAASERARLGQTPPGVSKPALDHQ